MKKLLLLLSAVLLTTVIYAQAETPEQVVDRQLEAYNGRNIDAFLATYADSIKIYNFPDQLSMDGKAAMREVYAKMFEQVPDLHCTIVKRIITGNKIIDHEHVTGFGEGRDIKAVAIYEVENGLISKVWFVR